MRKLVEIRRHSLRHMPGTHLSQEGVTLARRVGEGLGLFQRVVTSTLPRAFETALAMGFAVDEQIELMSTYCEDVEREIPYPGSFAAYAAAARAGAAGRYACSLAELYSQIAAALPERGKALIINHGGILELGITGCLPRLDYESWGGPAGYCEGARLAWEDGKFVEAQLLRIE
jgi:broad specificity phosphatase PhoE